MNKDESTIMSDVETLAERSHVAGSGEDVSARVRHAIEHGDVVRGGRLLPERELAEAIGVGRHQLRQVLANLEAEGVIWRRQGHGTFVTDLSPPQIDHFQRAALTTSPVEVMDVRLELEPILARYCALRASADQIAKIKLAASTTARAESTTQFASSDAAFHRAIAEGTNNTLFMAMFESVMTVLLQADWRAMRNGTFSHSRRAEVSQQHEDVVDAIARREPVKAEQAMRRHITSVYAYLQNGGA
jgi:GntR family transcriptional repressor for pyruvate dehydrogenase complex